MADKRQPRPWREERPTFFRSVFSKIGRNHETIDLNTASSPSGSPINQNNQANHAVLSSRGFGRPNKTGTSSRGNDSPVLSPSLSTYSGSGSPVNSSMPPVPASPGPNSVMSFGSDNDSQAERKPPYFFREEYSGLIVKGNFMTLAAKPVHVEEGEWLAHQGLCQTGLSSKFKV